MLAHTRFGCERNARGGYGDFEEKETLPREIAIVLPSRNVPVSIIRC